MEVNRGEPHKASETLEGPTMAEVGERDLIAAIHRLQPPAPPGCTSGIGDDTAVIEPPTGQKLLVSADMLVEGIHFRRDWMNPEQIGEKAVAVNISDIAAMGGTPYALLTSIALPGALPFAWAEGFYRGFARAADLYGAVLIGGDTVASPGPVVVDVTVMGWVRQPVMRRGARPGDRLLVTGRLGASRAGLELLLNGLRWPGEHAPERAVLAQHMGPLARVGAGQVLARRAHALTDISDGLATEVYELIRMGGIGARLDADRLPIDTPTRTVAAERQQDAIAWALYGGEDYELLAAVPPTAVVELVEAVTGLGVPLTDIGEVVDRSGLWLLQDGKEGRIDPHGGFQHWSASAPGAR